jgi:hypothetical protein
MKRTQYTPEQKTEYFNEMRCKWAQAKELSATDEMKAIYNQLHAMGIGDISIYNTSLILMQAYSLGLEGLPYVDFKTYENWQKCGFQVRKGEKSPVFSITWIGGKGSDDDTPSTGAGGGDKQDGRRYPKLTHLFHSSQVEAIS